MRNPVVIMFSIGTLVSATLAAICYVIFLSGFIVEQANRSVQELEEEDSILKPQFVAKILSIVMTPILVITMIIDGIFILLLKKNAFVYWILVIKLTVVVVVGGPLLLCSGAILFIYIAVALELSVFVIPGFEGALFSGVLLQTFFIGCGVLAGVLGNVVVLTLSGQGRLDVYQTRNTTSTSVSLSMEPLVTDEPL